MQSKLTPGNYISWRNKLIADLNISSETYKQRFLKGLSQALQERYTKSSLGKLEKPGLITRSTLELLFYFNRNTQRSFPQENRVAYLLNELNLSPQELWDQYATSLPINMAQENLQKIEYFHRHQKMNELYQLLQQVKNSTSMCGALVGMGGSGKTYLAAGIGLEPWIIDLFPDGVLWIQLSDNQRNHSTYTDGQNINLHLAPAISALENQLSGKKRSTQHYSSPLEKLAQLIAQQNILIVIDDVWEWESVLQLQNTLKQFKCKNCKILITTRLRLVASQLEIKVPHILETDQMHTEEIGALLQAGIDYKIPELTLSKLIALSDGSPLVVDLIKSQLKFKLRYHESHFEDTSQTIEPVCETLTHQLQECGPSALHNHGKEAKHSSLSRCFASNLSYLKLIDEDAPIGTKTREERFNSLCAFKKGRLIPYSFLSEYWNEPIGIVMAICEDLYDLTLIRDIKKNNEGELYISTYDVMQSFLKDKNKLADKYNSYREQKRIICEKMNKNTRNLKRPISSIRKDLELLDCQMN